MRLEIFKFLRLLLTIGFTSFLIIILMLYIGYFAGPVNLILLDTLQTIGTYLLSVFVLHKILLNRPDLSFYGGLVWN